jgi:DNA-binding MarR family transcriptional regulator
VHPSFEAAEKLNSLFGEVNTLATQCKQARPLFQDPADLAGGERSVLLILGRSHSHTVPEIARTRCTSRQNIQIVVNRLKEEGLVELTSNPGHKRSAHVCLTEKGRRLFQQIELSEAKLLNDLLVGLSQDELVSTTKCLQKLRQALATEARHSNGSEESSAALKNVHPNPMPQVEKRTRQSDPIRGLDEAIPYNDDAFPVNLL